MPDINQATTPPTIKLRVAAIVTDKGEFYAFGASGYDDDTATKIASDNIEADGLESLYWLEIELPYPQAKTVTPKVIPAAD